MGKGNRNRQNRVDEMQPVLQAKEDARRLERLVLIFGILTCVLLAATYAVQLIAQGEMLHNLRNDVYLHNGNSKEDIATLDSILPGGILGAALIAIGVLTTFVLTLLRRPSLSFIGIGVAALGAVFFVPFVMQIGVLFAEHTVTGTQVKRGLSFAKLLWKHYSMLLPIAAIIPSVVFAFRARKIRDIADVMQSALDRKASTLSLDD